MRSRLKEIVGADITSYFEGPINIVQQFMLDLRSRS